MPAPLTRIRPVGIVADLPPSNVGPESWTGGVNVNFRNGFTTRSLGWENIFPVIPGVPKPHFLINVTQAGVTNYWIACCESTVWVTDTTSWFDITPAGFVGNTRPEDWSGELLNGLPILNNQLNPPFYWDLDTGNPCQYLPGWPADTLCNYIAVSKYHVFALGIKDPSGDFPDQLFWSDAAAPGSVPAGWAPSATGDAGDVILGDSRSPILCAKQLRGDLMVFKSNSVYKFRYVGGTFVWANTKLLSNSGALSSKAAVEIPDGRMVFLSDGDIMLTDGQNVQSLIDMRWKNTLFKIINGDAYRTSWACVDQANSEVIFGVPAYSQEYPTYGLTWNYKNNAIGVRPLGRFSHMAAGIVTVAAASNTWESQTQTWADSDFPWSQSLYNAADDGLIACSPLRSRLSFIDSGTLGDGAPIISSVAKYYMDFDEPKTLKFIRRIWPRVTDYDDSVPWFIRVGSSDSIQEAINWQPFTEWYPAQRRAFDCFVNGRYISFEIQTNDGGQWTLAEVDFEMQAGGQW